MGLRGPAPKPTSIRKAEGNLSRRPLPANEPTYAAGIPDKPSGMSAAAKRVWDMLISEMAPSGVLRRVDGYALAQLAEDVAQLEELRLGRSRQIAQMDSDAKIDFKRALRAFVGDGRPWAQDDPHKKPSIDRMMPGGAANVLAQSIEGKRSDSVMRALSASIILQRREFGLTPASNSRVGATYGTPSMSPIEAALCARKLSA